MGNPAGRARLRQASLIAGMLIAFVQAIVLTLGLESWGVVQNYDGGFRVITVLTLMGTTSILVAMARLVDREGLGSGFAILLLAEVAPQVLDVLWLSHAEAPVSVLLLSLVVTGFLAGITLWMFSPLCLPVSRDYSHPALVSRPACGIAPLSVVPLILALAMAWSRAVGSQTESSKSTDGVLFLVVMGAAVLFACLFNSPSRIAALWTSLCPNAPEGIPRLKSVIIESVIFVALVELVDLWASQRLGYYAPRAVDALLTTAIVCDLVREWRARQNDPGARAIWEIHQPYAVPPTLRLLDAEGIPAFAKGHCLRSLLQFFGPYAPVQIVVPARDASRARVLLRATWPGAKAEPVSS